MGPEKGGAPKNLIYGPISPLLSSWYTTEFSAARASAAQVARAAQMVKKLKVVLISQTMGPSASDDCNRGDMLIVNYHLVFTPGL